ncbi:MAG: S24/S26 family peptidase [Candidatus Hermodarchaeia archaeon]|jgi:signal peptidase I
MEKLSLNHPEFAQLSSEILEKGNALRFTAHGSSMAPFIRDGDVLTVEPATISELRMGDIVLYRTEGDSVVAHRIVGILGSSLKVRGDASPGSESFIAPDQVLGVIIIVERTGDQIKINEGLWRVLGLLWIFTYPLPLLAFRLIRKIRTTLRI